MIEKMGGRAIFETKLQKDIPMCHAETIIYEWVDPDKDVNAVPVGSGFFSMCTTREDFEKRYAAQL